MFASALNTAYNDCNTMNCSCVLSLPASRSLCPLHGTNTLRCMVPTWQELSSGGSDSWYTHVMHCQLYHSIVLGCGVVGTVRSVHSAGPRSAALRPTMPHCQHWSCLRCGVVDSARPYDRYDRQDRTSLQTAQEVHSSNLAIVTVSIIHPVQPASSTSATCSASHCFPLVRLIVAARPGWPCHPTAVYPPHALH